MTAEIVIPFATAVVGYATGFLTSPRAKWRVEKTRLQHQRRVDQIKEWRDGVASLRLAEDEDTKTPLGRTVVVYPDGTDERDFSDISRFGWFATLEPRLSKEARWSLDQLRDEQVHYRKGQIPNLLEAEISRIEGKWEVV